MDSRLTREIIRECEKLEPMGIECTCSDNRELMCVDVNVEESRFSDDLTAMIICDRTYSYMNPGISLNFIFKTNRTPREYKFVRVGSEPVYKRLFKNIYRKVSRSS